MDKIAAPGIYEMSAADYHADPCPEPSLSSSLIKILTYRTPRHAWLRHPRFNPSATGPRKEAFDLGSVAHALLLEGREGVWIIDAPDYRTKAAQDARNRAWAKGQTPILAHQMDEVRAMVDSAKLQLWAHEATAKLVPIKPEDCERTLIWREGSIWCRARVDWVTPDCLYDYKTTSAAATAEDWAGAGLFNTGADLQAAFYMRGWHALHHGQRADFRFICQENEAPYPLAIFGLSPTARSLAESRVAEAIGLWEWCVKADHWPGYLARVAYVDAPAWHERNWQNRSIARRLLADSGVDLRRALLDWRK